MADDRVALIHEQFRELAAKFSDLELSEDQPGLWVIRGDVHFSALFDGEAIKDSFSILITLPPNYPDAAPTVQETGGRIHKSFHTFAEGYQCLGTRVDVERRFAQNRCLLHFVEHQVVPYLYSFSYWFKNAHNMPWGELPHGGPGLLQYYNDLFHVSGHIPALSLLRVLVEGYPGHLRCPCGSDQVLRRCHGPLLRQIAAYGTPKSFFLEMGHIWLSLSEDDRNRSKEVIPKRFLEQLRKKRSKLHDKHQYASV